MSQDTVGGPVTRASYLVFGAREVDESDDRITTYCQFEKDWEAQLERCARLAAERGYRPVGSSVFSAAQPTLDRVLEWAGEPGCEVVIVGSDRVLRRFRDTWPDWDRVVARLRAAGAEVEAAPYPEPCYRGEELADEPSGGPPAGRRVPGPAAPGG
ncbi:VOC family protein [Streptomyces pactum]|uniref:VOC family protein n=1 Tax=Streptomyces pactum TaxID=68249 RepID=UPI001E34F056|nr:VOC family protein [Streptomyces pactum]